MVVLPERRKLEIECEDGVIVLKQNENSDQFGDPENRIEIPIEDAKQVADLIIKLSEQ